MLVTPTYFGKDAVVFLNLIIESKDYPSERALPFLRRAAGIYKTRVEELKDVLLAIDSPVDYHSRDFSDQVITDHEFTMLKTCAALLSDLAPLEVKEDGRELVKEFHNYKPGLDIITTLLKATIENEEIQLRAIQNKIAEINGGSNH